MVAVAFDRQVVEEDLLAEPVAQIASVFVVVRVALDRPGTWP